MKAREIRQSFLDFFQSKEHQVVSSASLLPESPNLLFTNAGMNQFVPYFLGDQQARRHVPLYDRASPMAAVRDWLKAQEPGLSESQE